MPTMMPPETSKDTTSSFKIAPATLKDATAIAALGAASWTSAFGWSVSATDLDAYISSFYTVEAWQKELVDPTADTYVARSPTSPSTILGFVQLKRGTTEPCLKGFEGPPLELHRIYVDAKSQGKGVGKALLKFADGKAREAGNEYMWLGVWEHNEKALGVYKAVGYERRGEHDFVIGGDVQTDWVMVKKL